MVQEPVRDESLRVRPGAPSDTVVVEAYVESNGRVGTFRIMRGRDRIDRNVAAMIRTAAYRPARQGDRPVRAIVRIEVPIPARPMHSEEAGPGQ
jgi:outer membrane biosynthesis protein TonB